VEPRELDHREQLLRDLAEMQSVEVEVIEAFGQCRCDTPARFLDVRRRIGRSGRTSARSRTAARAGTVGRHERRLHEMTDHGAAPRSRTMVPLGRIGDSPPAFGALRSAQPYPAPTSAATHARQLSCTAPVKARPGSDSASFTTAVPAGLDRRSTRWPLYPAGRDEKMLSAEQKIDQREAPCRQTSHLDPKPSTVHQNGASPVRELADTSYA
jgi:hypothetical protein